MVQSRKFLPPLDHEVTATYLVQQADIPFPGRPDASRMRRVALYLGPDSASFRLDSPLARACLGSNTTEQTLERLAARSRLGSTQRPHAGT